MLNIPKPTYLSERELGEIIGRHRCSKTTTDDVIDLIGHIRFLESLLDKADESDAFGIEGWRARGE